MLGLVRAVLVTRELGAAQLGVIAVLAAVPRGVITFLDARLSDVASRLYYRDDGPDGAEGRQYRASVIQLCLLSYVLLSLLTVLLSVVLSTWTMQYFTATPVSLWWIIAQAAAIGILNVSSASSFLQRFTERFTVMGVTQLSGQLLSLAIFVGCLLAWPSLSGYYAGTLAGCLTTALLSFAVLAYLNYRYTDVSLLNRRWRIAWPDYRRELKFLFLTNVLGYTKMLHRGTDVLLVGYFADDRTTGVYRLARTFADGLFVLFDALNQVYLPRFFGLLRERQFGVYRNLARKLLIGGAMVTLVALAGELTVLPWIFARLLPAEFRGIELTIAVLTVPMVGVLGVHLWIWPLLVHRGRIGHFTTISVLSVAAHYLITALLLAQGGSATAAALGYLSKYVVVYPASFLLALRICPEVVPVSGRWSQRWLKQVEPSA